MLLCALAQAVLDPRASLRVDLREGTQSVEVGPDARLALAQLGAELGRQEPDTTNFPVHDAAADACKSDDAQEYAQCMLKYAVVRLEATYVLTNPLCPNEFSDTEHTSDGSGFIVANNADGLLIATSAHVVLNAQKVTCHFPASNDESYVCHAVLVMPEWDLALVSVTQAVRVTMEATPPVSLVALPIAEPGSCQKENEVLAVGFPPEKSTVTFAMGVIAGGDFVEGNYVLQHTEHVGEEKEVATGPGDGSPLLKLFSGANETHYIVCGVHFAKSANLAAESIKYAVLGYHVQQLLDYFQSVVYGAAEATQGDAGDQRIALCTGTSGGHGPSDCELRVPVVGATTVHPTPIQYQYFGGDACGSKGVLVTKIKEESVFYGLNEFKEHSFITEVKVRGTWCPLNRFGMCTLPQPGLTMDPVSFRDLMFSGEDIISNAILKVCVDGIEKELSVGLDWTDPKKARTEVQPDIVLGDYEDFAGVTIMQLDRHLAQVLVTQGELFELMPYILDAPQPADHACSLTRSHVLLVTQAPEQDIDKISTDSLDSVFKPGDVLRSINGFPVGTLDEYRAHFCPTYSANQKRWAAATAKRLENIGTSANALLEGGEDGCGDSLGKAWELETSGGAVFIAPNFTKALLTVAQAPDTGCVGSTPFIRRIAKETHGLEWLSGTATAVAEMDTVADGVPPATPALLQASRASSSPFRWDKTAFRAAAILQQRRAIVQAVTNRRSP